MLFATPPATTTDFGNIIIPINALSKSGFGAILAIARRALQAPQQATGTPPRTETLLAALDAIWRKAEQFGNDINVKAEGAGRT